MQPLICIVLGVVFCLSFLLANRGLAQGTVNFNTAVSATSVVSYAPGTSKGGATGARVDGTLNLNARAALYAGPAGSTEAQLQLILPLATFGSGVLAGYVSAGSRTITFLPQGYQNAVVQVRAWDGLAAFNSYEEAFNTGSSWIGKSPLYTVSGALGGPGNSETGVPPATAVNIPGQVGFFISPLIPEPSCAVLGLLSLGVFWGSRCRQIKYRKHGAKGAT